MRLFDLYKKFSIRRKIYLANCKKKLKNNNFTLITPNCMGGMIYHDLGLRFLSPTINLQIFPFDKFILNMKEYLEKDLVFVESDKEFPVAMLGDLTICFTHYHSKKEALQKWNDRKKRIVWDNIYI